MNGIDESRRSQKLGKNISKPTARLPSVRRKEKVETLSHSTSENAHDVRENTATARGNKVQEIWEATQRTVKMIIPETVNKVSSPPSRENCSTDGGQAGPTKSEYFNSPLCYKTKRGPAERKNHFQNVMAELKSKSRARQGMRDNMSMPQESESLTYIQPRPRNETQRFPNDTENTHVPVTLFDCSTPPSLNQNQSTPGQVKNWLSKASLFQKASPTVSEKSVHASTTSSKRRFRNISPGSKSMRGSIAATEAYLDGKSNNAEISISSQVCSDAIPSFRRGSRLIRAFRRNGDFEDLKRSRSLDLSQYYIGGLFTDSCDLELPQVAPNVRLVDQVQELIRVMDACENSLTSLRAKCERNSLELLSETQHINQMMISLTQKEERRYRDLLDSLYENSRMLGQVESGFDYFHTIISRHKRATLRHRCSGWLIFLLDHVVASLLTIVYVVTSVYSHFRFRSDQTRGTKHNIKRL